ncbi:hypothetical protein GOODEAATRI_007716 [Goodea atripinnis]|uniref:Secreted protein n=1 Tax=Goodea atripinnis TaxID=208336 RepID=A0ABV0NJD2_9TELE
MICQAGCWDGCRYCWLVCNLLLVHIRAHVMGGVSSLDVVWTPLVLVAKECDLQTGFCLFGFSGISGLCALCWPSDGNSVSFFLAVVGERGLACVHAVDLEVGGLGRRLI